MADVRVHPETVAGDPLAVAGERLATNREHRALRLYIQHGNQIEQVAPDLYWCPSQDGKREHLVSYPVGPGGVESCSCPDRQFRGATCVHILAVVLYHSKRQAQRRRNFVASLSATEEEEAS